jgi:membrane-bound lytic murein transglycosylase B
MVGLVSAPRVFLVLVALLAAACGGSAVATVDHPARVSAHDVAASRPVSRRAARSARPFTPSPSEYVPVKPASLARMLTMTTAALRGAIGRWTHEGNPSKGQPPLRVQLLALYQQRIYRSLARHRDRAERTIARLPGWLRQEVRANVAAGRWILSLAGHATRRVRVRVGLPKPAGVLLRYDRRAQRRFHVSWAVLASINYVESKFGRVRSASGAGAQGPMQFIPSTWAAYGMGGDVHDPHDAIMGAANYLHASGAPANYRDAVHAYNPSWAYVRAVLLYAKQMHRDVRAFYEYYDWQVFVMTPSGDRRLTGPGLR